MSATTGDVVADTTASGPHRTRPGGRKRAEKAPRRSDGHNVRVSGAKTLIDALPASWRFVVTAGSGEMDTSTYGPPRSDGTRPTLTVRVPVQSEAVRLDGPDRKRAVAVWVSRDAGASWKSDGAWCWRRHERYDVPVTWPMNVKITELKIILREHAAPEQDAATTDEEERAAT